MAGKIAKVLLEVVGDTSGLDKTVADANRKMKGIGGRGVGGGVGGGGVGAAGGFGSAGAAAAGGALGAGASSPSAFRQKMDGMSSSGLNRMRDEMGIRRDRGNPFSNAMGRAAGWHTGRANALSDIEADTGDPTGMGWQRRHQRMARGWNKASGMMSKGWGAAGSLGEGVAGLRNLVPGISGPTAGVAAAVAATTYIGGFNKSRAAEYSDISRFKGADYETAKGIRKRAQEKKDEPGVWDSFWLGAEKEGGEGGSWMSKSLSKQGTEITSTSRELGKVMASGSVVDMALFLRSRVTDALDSTPLGMLYNAFAGENNNVSMRRAGA